MEEEYGENKFKADNFQERGKRSRIHNSPPPPPILYPVSLIRADLKSLLRSQSHFARLYRNIISYPGKRKSWEDEKRMANYFMA